MNEEKIEREFTKKETDRRCPSCGGTMNFSPETGGLVCPFCGRKEQIEAGEGSGELDFFAAESTENCDWGSAKKFVICESCGAELVYDELNISSKCPYCDSNLVMQESSEDTMAPGGVCPFTVTKEQAGSRFLSWLKGKLFCPSKVKKQAKAREMQGVYLPYWTFDCDTDSEYRADYSKSHTRTVNGKTETYTTWHNTSGYYSRSFDDEETVASDRYDASLLAGIGKFDTQNNVEYKPEYVAGFAAERYSIGLKDAWERVKAVISRLLRSDVRKKVKHEESADSVNVTALNTTFSNITYKYLLLPVWISSFKYNDKVYSFMVNGRTGKVAGKYPISPWRVLAAVGIVLAIVIVGYLLFRDGDAGSVYYY